MAWSYRVVQLESGRWLCRFGRELFDEHDAMAPALEHSGAIASRNASANLFVHHLDGRVHLIASYPNGRQVGPAATCIDVGSEVDTERMAEPTSKRISLTP
jgi:hypothetical protein